jgi:hypothetical protein
VIGETGMEPFVQFAGDRVGEKFSRIFKQLKIQDFLFSEKETGENENHAGSERENKNREPVHVRPLSK